jgi:hypothetical protein
LEALMVASPIVIVIVVIALGTLWTYIRALWRDEPTARRGKHWDEHDRQRWKEWNSTP